MAVDGAAVDVALVTAVVGDDVDVVVVIGEAVAGGAVGRAGAGFSASGS